MKTRHETTQPTAPAGQMDMKAALIMILVMMAPMLDTTMTNIGINTILKDLNSTVNTIQWVTSAYVLALGLAVPLAGWLVDQLSGKLLMEIAQVAFLVGSLVSGMASNVSMLLIGRIVQGAAAGIIIPLATTLMIRMAQGQNLGHLMSVVGLPIVFAPILGPTVGGALIKFWSWHWLFYINIPVIVVALVLVQAYLPTFAPNPDKRRPFDFVGFTLIVGLFSGLIVAVTNFSQDDIFGKLSVLAPGLLALDCLLGYVVYAAKWPRRALLPLKLFNNAHFSASAILLFMSGLMVNGAMFALPLFLQTSRHLSVIMTGVYLIALGAGMLVTRTQVGKITDTYGAKWVVIISLVMAVVTTIPFAYFTESTPDWLILTMLFLMGLSRSGVTIPIMSDSYTGLNPELIPEATVTTRMAQNIGGSIATAILAAVIASDEGNNVATTAMMATAYYHTFIWIAVGTAVAIIPALFLSVKTKAVA
ncbi:DHA2 family efflux MFS transporter permease subunit [Lactiplantibacillus nangangensis]|uniref:DHA2 family efflux MFS transporter permease subunit n=1 Tax=Lactiplantibacillus nangangensis TaxID=2559917 RepID=A0ABW1SG60_9LACO|nr:DHA2 family efflux MFS transporter permease subunit [Lactiplantibacillus nangangensis]